MSKSVWLANNWFASIKNRVTRLPSRKMQAINQRHWPLPSPAAMTSPPQSTLHHPSHILPKTHQTSRYPKPTPSVDLIWTSTARASYYQMISWTNIKSKRVGSCPYRAAKNIKQCTIFWGSNSRKMLKMKTVTILEKRATKLPNKLTDIFTCFTRPHETMRRFTCQTAMTLSYSILKRTSASKPSASSNAIVHEWKLQKIKG